MTKPKYSCSITMLKASEGDCLFSEFCYEGKIFSILIDTGPMSCWEPTLKPFLDRLSKEEKQIDVLLISHFDADHLGGALRLFESKDYSKIIRQVWFNGFKQIVPSASNEASQEDRRAFRILQSMHEHLPPATDSPISVRQANSLAVLLERCGKPVNPFVNGTAITSNTASVQIAPGFSIDFLLPDMHSLNRLKAKMQKEMKRAVRGASLVHSEEADAAFEAVMLDEKLLIDNPEPISATDLDLSNIEKWSTCSSEKDLSITNISSIAICIRFYGYKLLLPGDAAGEDLVTALIRWGQRHNESLHFDVIKLPHHGTLRSCGKLLDVVDGTYFLLSTDGKHHSHPSKETLAKIVTHSGKHTRFLLFNYDNDMYRLFHKENFEVQYGYHSQIMEGSLKIGGNKQ